ncbi:MAG: site-specific integrase, partial [Rickettsiales bacterium]|nr:site-specific integrase [Rickettsiales bacterium]
MTITSKQPTPSPIATDAQIQMRNWLKEMASVRRASDHSIEAYLHDVSSFLAFLHQHAGESVTLAVLEKMEERDVRSWLAYRAGRGYAKSSNARALSAVRTFFKYLNNHAGIRNLAPLQVPTPKLDKPLPKAPSIAQTNATLEGLEANDDAPWIG